MGATSSAFIANFHLSTCIFKRDQFYSKYASFKDYSFKLAPSYSSSLISMLKAIHMKQYVILLVQTISPTKRSDISRQLMGVKRYCPVMYGYNPFSMANYLIKDRDCEKNGYTFITMTFFNFITIFIVGRFLHYFLPCFVDSLINV